MANKWLQHVKQVKAQNKHLPLKQVLKIAAQSYKKQKQQEVAAAHNAAPVSGAAENFAHGGAEGEDPEKQQLPKLVSVEPKQAKEKKPQKQTAETAAGWQKRSRKYKGNQRRAAGKKSRDALGRRRR